MDNFFQNCPPMMEDQGRQLGDFKTANNGEVPDRFVHAMARLSS